MAKNNKNLNKNDSSFSILGGSPFLNLVSISFAYSQTDSKALFFKNIVDTTVL